MVEENFTPKGDTMSRKEYERVAKAFRLLSLSAEKAERLRRELVVDLKGGRP